jgi:hypothetical protein
LVVAVDDPVLALDDPEVALDEPVDDTFACDEDRVLAVDVAPEVLDDETLPIWLPMTFGLDPADDREPDKLVADVFDPELELD